MLLDQAALCKQAAMVESLELKEMKFHPAFMSELDNLLSDVYVSLLPNSSEYEQRKQLVQAYSTTVETTFGNIGGFPVVEAFGSFTMNIFTAKSDLDLSINFDKSNAKCLPRVQVISVLRRFAKILRRKQSMGQLSGVLLILSAKVPVLKAVDCKTGIECDISVENKDGISRSLFFSIISSIDERFRIISFLMKAWAKANDINSSKDHTMNSVSIISLVALHFQTRDPPILPPFSALLRDGADITKLRSFVPEFMNLATRNKESVAELFIALLAKLASVQKLWEVGLCASNFEGSWISKTWTSKFGSNMNVEDFLDRDQNFARSVGKSKMSKIYDCLRRSLGYLSSSMQGQIEISALGTLLFGSIALHTRTSHAITNAGAANKQKLPIKSIHPRADVINESSRALGKKQTSYESIQTHVQTKTTSRTGLKRKQISTKSTPPFACATAPAKHTAINSGGALKMNPPIETAKLKLPVQTLAKEINTISLETKPPVRRAHVTNDSSKRPRYNQVAGELPPGHLQNQNYTYFPMPTMHPDVSYYLPPLNGIRYQNTYAHQPPPQHRPVSLLGPVPQYRPVSLLGPVPQYRPMAPVSSGMSRYYSNPVHPVILDGRHNPGMFPGYTSNAGYP